MTKTIGLADAKARFSEIVDRVEAGETVIISRNGDPVLEMRALHRLSSAEVVAKIREIGRRVAKRNAGKPAWPPEGERLRNVAHDRHRF